MVKANPSYENARGNSFSLLFVGLMNLGLWVFISSSHRGGVPFLVLGLLFLASGLFIFLWTRHFKSLNARRQAAANGNALLVSLAEVQPIPAETALPLPFTIKMRPRCWKSIAVGGLFALYVIFGMVAYTWIPGIGVNEWVWQSLDYSVIILSFAFIVFLPTSLFLVWAGHCQITATGEGLAIRQTGGTQSVYWSDVSLFAIMPRRIQTALPNLYELSSTDTIIYVHRVRRNTLFPLSMQPTPVR